MELAVNNSAGCFYWVTVACDTESFLICEAIPQDLRRSLIFFLSIGGEIFDNFFNHKLKFDVHHEARQSSQLLSPDRFRCFW